MFDGQAQDPSSMTLELTVPNEEKKKEPTDLSATGLFFVTASDHFAAG
jgi:hypothetical protein